MAHVHQHPGAHDLTVSGYIVQLKAGSEPRVLLHLHKKLNKWLQFGGHVEQDENPWQALTRELMEESGYDLRQLQLLQCGPVLPKVEGVEMHPIPVVSLTHKYGDEDHYHDDLGYAFVTVAEPDSTKLNVGESKTIRLFTVQELAELKDDEIPVDVRVVALYVLNDILPAARKREI